MLSFIFTNQNKNEIESIERKIFYFTTSEDVTSKFIKEKT